MEKTIRISNKDVKFKCTGGFLIKFRELTGKDPIKSITSMENILSNLREKNKKNFSINDFELEQLMVFYEIIWVLAKTADKEIGDLFDWIDSFDEFPLADIIIELLELIQQAFKTNLTLKESKKK